MQVEIKKYSSFEVLPDSYLHLFAKAADERYDYSLPWFQNFARTALDHDDQICIYGVEENGTNTPLAILVTRFKAMTRGIFSPARISSLSNFYTITYGPLGEFSEGRSTQALGMLAAALAADHRWDLVELRPLDPQALIYPNLLQAFRNAGMVVQPYFCFGNWYLPTVGLSYEAYFKTLPSAIQNTIRRKSKKLEKTGRARIDLVTGAEGVEPAIEAYEKIYLSSWKRPEPFPNFVPGLVRTCAEKGWLRMGVVYMDDQPIAAQVWIVNARKATIYKLGHDQRFDEFSAGSILTTKLIEYVLEVDRVHEIDFGSGDDSYKKNWLSQRRERWGIVAMNPRTFRGCLSILCNVGGRELKNVWKRITDPGRAAHSNPAPDQMLAPSDGSTV